MPKPTKAGRPNVSRKKALLSEWERVRELVIQRAKVGELFQCHHCGQLFPRNEVCADHYPFPRNVRPDLKTDPNNLVCSCKFCNRSDSPTRSH